MQAGKFGTRMPVPTPVLAAGDVRSGSIKRVASAVGEGAMAGRVRASVLGGDVRGDAGDPD